MASAKDVFGGLKSKLGIGGREPQDNYEEYDEYDTYEEYDEYGEDGYDGAGYANDAYNDGSYAEDSYSDDGYEYEDDVRVRDAGETSRGRHGSRHTYDASGSGTTGVYGRATESRRATGVSAPQLVSYDDVRQSARAASYVSPRSAANSRSYSAGSASVSSRGYSSTASAGRRHSDGLDSLFSSTSGAGSAAAGLSESRAGGVREGGARGVDSLMGDVRIPEPRVTESRVAESREPSAIGARSGEGKALIGAAAGTGAATAAAGTGVGTGVGAAAAGTGVGTGVGAATNAAAANSTAASSAAWDPYDAYNGDSVSYRIQRELVILRPKDYGEVASIARTLKGGDVIVLSLRLTPASLSKRVLDFSFGVASALDATVDCISDKVFVVVRGESLTDEERSKLHNQGII